MAFNQSADSRLRGQISSLLGGTRTTLEGRADSAAGTLGNIGESEISAMLNSLGIATGSTGEAGKQITADINSRREASAQMWGSLIGGALGVAGSFAGKP